MSKYMTSISSIIVIHVTSCDAIPCVTSVQTAEISIKSTALLHKSKDVTILHFVIMTNYVPSQLYHVRTVNAINFVGCYIPFMKVLSINTTKKVNCGTTTLKKNVPTNEPTIKPINS